MQRAGKYKISH